MPQSNYEKLPIDSVDRELQDQIGTGAGTRTPDPRIMIPLLYQLSYTGTAADDSVSGRCCPDRPSRVIMPAVYRPKTVLRTVADLMLPSSCILCRCRTTPDKYLCSPCNLDLPPLSPICPRCLHRPGKPADRCPGCYQGSPMKPLIHLSWHEGALRNLILIAKSSHSDRLAEVLALQLAQQIDKCEEIQASQFKPVVLAIPRSLRRKFSHGMPLSERIAHPLAQYLGLPFRRWLRRRGSLPQVALSASGRRKLRENSFFLKPSKKEANGRNQTAILVDDVRTTGTTLSTATRALERQNISVRLWVVVSISRTSQPSQAYGIATR